MFKLPLFISVLLVIVGCAKDNENAQQGEQQEQPPVMQQNVEKDIHWVDYADAIADANLAIGKGNFALLAFTNRTISLPGLDMRQDELVHLEQVCGFRYLAGSGDELSSETDMQRRKRLRVYAIQYNQLMLQACQKKRLTP
jgi:hypothetical protein